jgi:hypothetical protein
MANVPKGFENKAGSGLPNKTGLNDNASENIINEVKNNEARVKAQSSENTSGFAKSNFDYEEAQAAVQRDLAGAQAGVKGIPSLESDMDEHETKFGDASGLSNETILSGLAEPVTDSVPVLTDQFENQLNPRRRTLIGNEEPDMINEQPHNFPIHPQAHELAHSQDVLNALEEEQNTISMGGENDGMGGTRRPRAVRKSSVKLGPEAIGENLLGKGLIKATPLQMPDMLDVRAKDPSVAFRWVNFKSEEGRRVSIHLGQGFQFAQQEDIANGVNINIANTMRAAMNNNSNDKNLNANGWITCYDVVLMKIGKLRLLEAYEYNLQKSQRMVSRKGVKEAAIAKAIETLRQGLPEDFDEGYLKGRVQYFAPPDAQAEALNR